MPLIMDSPNTELLSALATLLEAGKYSDLKITCRGREYAVHRAIICSRSGFFDGACRNAFKESNTGVIDLSEDDGKTVEHMIHYFYHLDYLSKPLSRKLSQRSTQSRPTTPANARSPPRRGRSKLNLALVEDPLLAQAAASTAILPTPPEDFSRNIDSTAKVWLGKSEDEPATEESLESDTAEGDGDSEESDLMVHAKVYAIAEKYGIAGLKALARRKFITQVDEHWSDGSFPAAIEEVYESTVDTDRGLRDVVIQTFRSHPDLMQRKDVEEVARMTPQLSWELFKVASGMPVR